MGLTKAQLEALNITSFPDNTTGLITPTILRGYNTASIENTVNQDVYTTDSASFKTSITNLNAATASYVTSAITASSLVTASFAAGTLTFTKGNGTTFGVVIPDVSGSTIPSGTVSSSAQIVNYGIFATTGSNTFRGNQIISGAFQSLGDNVNDVFLFRNGSSNGPGIKFEANSAGINLGTNGTLNLESIGGTGTTFKINAPDNNGNANLNFDVSGIAGNDIISISARGTNNTASLVIEDANSSIPFILFEQNPVKTTIYNKVDISGSLDITGSLSASLQQGYVLVGDSNNRTQLVATSSFGSTINTGSFATTGSNAFIGNQTIAGGLIVSSSTQPFAFSGSSFMVDTFTGGGAITFRPGTAINFQGNTNFTSPIRTTLINVDNFAAGGYYGFNSEIDGRIYQDFSGSVNTRINNIVAGTGFATTGSNQFTGNQAIDGTLTITGKIIGSSSIILQPNANDARTLEIYNTSPADTHITASGGELFLGNDETYVLVNTNANQKLVVIRGDEKIVASGSLDISGSLTSSLQQGYVLVGNSNNRTQLVATSSFGGGGSINTGSFATTGSNTFVGNQIISTTGNSQLTLIATPGFQTNVDFQSENSNFRAYGDFNIVNNGQYGGSGSIKIIATKNNLSIASDDGVKIGATNGGGNGIDAGNISMQVRSGSLSLAPSGISNTTASLSHLSSSSNTTFVNLIFKNNSTNGDTIISGSNNIFTNPGAVTAGFKRYIGGSQNYYGAILPQITGSAAFSPSMNNNILATGMLMRIPVSSSAYTMNGNVLMNPAANGIQLGTAAATNFEKAVSGLTFTNNVINGTVFATAYKTPLSASVAINTNVVAGTVTMNLDSSSFTLAQNNINGTFTVNNSYFPGTVTAASATVSAATNIIGGTLTLYTSGSNTTFTGAPRSVQNSLSSGAGNVISASLNGDNSSVNSNNLLGQALLVYGNNSRPAAATAADWGSTFVGRWNAVNNNRAFTADTVFAVGTGTAEATRKTGFLIDSGSNTFVEGSLNVSGSTTITGSLIVSASSAGGAIATFNSRVLITGPTSGNTPNLIISGSDAVATTRRFAWDINSQNTSTVNPSLTMYAHPSASTTISMGVYDPITFADSGEFLVQTTKNGTIMQDFQDGGAFGYNTWLTIPRNDGTDPKPIFNRGLEIQSGSSFFANGTKQFNVGAFQSNVTQSGSANVSQSMNFETTDISQGVSIASNSRITLANSGTYNIQFSSQFDRITGSGNDTVHVWLKKNGVNYTASAGVLTVSGGANQAKALAAWNYVVDTLSTDYWELCWQASDTNIQMISFAASGNIPRVPSVILTVTQVR